MIMWRIENVQWFMAFSLDNLTNLLVLLLGMSGGRTFGRNYWVNFKYHFGWLMVLLEGCGGCCFLLVLCFLFFRLVLFALFLCRLCYLRFCRALLCVIVGIMGRLLAMLVSWSCVT